MKQTVIIIVGPTAVGKTDMAIQIARHFSTQIISCDSRQCFKELNIGVAKPSAEQLAAVPHHFIGSHSIHQPVNAATFEQYALQKVADISSINNVVVMTGGTGLYVKAFCEGMNEVPEVNAAIRTAIINEYEVKGIEWLQAEVRKNDKQFFVKGEMQNPQRMMRALEVMLSTGRSIMDFHSKQKKNRPFNVIKIGLQLPRPLLAERINRRVDLMMEQGLLAEVKALKEYQNLNALQTVGYRELFSFLNSETSLSAAVDAIKVNTRQYAKRQMTWFKKDEAVQWCDVNYSQVLNAINSVINI